MKLPGMEAKGILSVLLVHRNTVNLIRQCISSLQAQVCIAPSGSEMEFEIVVVDNASRPQQRPRDLPDGVTVLFNDSNRGYAAAMNRALERSRGEFVLFSNPDTWYFPGALQALLDAVHTLPKAGAVGPRIWWEKQRQLLLPPADSATLVEQTFRRLVRLRGSWSEKLARRWLAETLEYWQAKTPLKVAALSGACILARRQAIRQVGTFDECFRLYFEDTDWCRRMGKEGYLLYCVPEAEIVHYYNQSGRQETEAQNWFAQSEEVYFRKHYGFVGSGVRRVLQGLSGMDGGRLEKGVIHLGRRSERPDLKVAGGAPAGPFLVLFSPVSTFVPAAGGLIECLPYRMPTEVWTCLQEGPLFARIASVPDLDFLATWKWEKKEKEGIEMERHRSPSRGEEKAT